MDLLNYHKHKATSSFINTTFSRGCVPLINRPTRIINESATLIEQHCISGIIPTDFSDHLPIFHITCHKKPCNNDQFVSRRDINQANVLKFIECMRSTDWSFVTEGGGGGALRTVQIVKLHILASRKCTWLLTMPICQSGVPNVEDHIEIHGF